MGSFVFPRAKCWLHACMAHLYFCVPGVKARCCIKFCLKFDKNTWKTPVDPRRKVAWFAEDLNNDIKVNFTILS